MHALIAMLCVKHLEKSVKEIHGLVLSGERRWQKDSFVLYPVIPLNLEPNEQITHEKCKL